MILFFKCNIINILGAVIRRVKIKESGEIQGFYNSREMFFDAIEQLNCKGFTDIQRAARYFIKIPKSRGEKKTRRFFTFQ